MMKKIINKAIILIMDNEPGKYAFCEIAGTPLFKRAILSGQRAGIDEFFILCKDRNTHEIETYLSGDKRIKSKINIIDISSQGDDETKKHVNIIHAAKHNYFIINGNTIFDYSLLLKLSQFDLKSAFAAISINKHMNTFREEPGEWYVKLSDANIVDISKDPKFYDGKATGIMLASSGAVNILVENYFSSPNFSLEEWIWLQIKDKELKAFDIKDNLSMEVVSELHLRECEIRLYNSLGSSVDGPIIDKYINRRISKLITKQLVKTHITPNQTTFLSLIIGIASAWFFMSSGFWNYLAGGLVFQLSFIFDQCDGEIARLKFMESKIGGWFDAFCDSIIRMLIILGMTGSLYATTNQSLILILGILSSIGIFVSTMVSSYETLKKEEKYENTGSVNISTTNESKIGSFIDKFNNTDSFSIILFICILSGHLTWFLWTIGIGSFAFTLVIMTKLIIIGKT